MNSTLVLKPEESAEKQKNDIDVIAIAVDVLVPFVLDNFLFKGTKGRLMKLVGTVAAQQLIKMLAKSKTVDDILDQLEAWLQHPSKKPAKPFPAIGDAVRQNSKKYRTRSKPEDYYDPEREMFY
ncbi:MAG: hypothetical protein IPO45_17130 [Saprospiraceae bacterium]|jgi:hypothetical protein|uniref:hypothetical protein n=1 Tax=Candidatus Brachybacter algidus TaxID=2982024 RepID=UPI001B618059|nr:hypothetical protein [Candidatus Brachybacter algidus]MBP7307273.1 hypothetical protein [Saprospiraceae bacterium]MBK7604070.1 hypothetical protein [Candidatus Brachybacter algidus]MBK8603908.1 hypothetical protein [Candidatus Brachybacter algidus]MBK8748011.1 hypothetical protein [Candidatus Brachybacter algidus]MBK9023405.1 hypothetical protein [Candidatus Brachybacter algidus]